MDIYMTTAERTRCTKCNKLKNSIKCAGCAQDFCLDDMIAHRQELGEQLGHTEDRFNQFTHEIERETTKPHEHPIMELIDRWEQRSTAKIQQMANQVRRELSIRLMSFTADLQLRLKQLSENLVKCRQENDFVDTDIHYYNEQLKLLRSSLSTPPTLRLQHTLTSFIDRIHLMSDVPLPPSANCARTSVTAAGGNGQGIELNQLKHPLGVRVDTDHTLYIADYGNNRIVAWKPAEKTGRVLAGGNGKGNRADQLSSPTDVVIDHQTNSLLIADYGNKRVIQWPLENGKQGETIISNVGCWGLAMDDIGSLYVSDYDRHEVKRFRIGQKQGTVVAGGNGQGSHLDQLPCPTYVFVDQSQSVYVSDHNNHRVMKWEKHAREGVVVAGGEGQGNRLSQLSHPSGIVGDQFGGIYVADHFNDRVMRWSQNAREGTVIIAGNQLNQLSFPIGLTLDSQDRLYVTDTENSRVQKYNIDRV